MKWPETLTLIRHAESSYNEARRIKQTDLLYQRFLEAFDKEWNGKEARSLAQEVAEKFALGIGDSNTPLSQDGNQVAQTTGEKLRELIVLPDVIFVSPYVRTRETLEWMKKGWPELEEVKIYEEERIREQEHGLALLWKDCRLMSLLRWIIKNLAGSFDSFNNLM